MTRLEENTVTNHVGADTASDVGADTLDARWARWRAKGHADDARTRRWAMAAAMAFGVCVVVVALVWLVRRG